MAPCKSSTSLPPSIPVEVGTYYTADAALAVAISAGHVYVTDFVAGLAVFNECQGPVFADDFESGDTSAWSMIVP